MSLEHSKKVAVLYQPERQQLGLVIEINVLEDHRGLVMNLNIGTRTLLIIILSMYNT